MSALTEIYYQPEHLWLGRKAIKKLQDESKLPRKQVVKFLAKQAFMASAHPTSKTHNPSSLSSDSSKRTT